MIPYDKRSGKIWYNDELVDWGDVKLHVLSHGLHYASCVFVVAVVVLVVVVSSSSSSSRSSSR